MIGLNSPESIASVPHGAESRRPLSLVPRVPRAEVQVPENKCLVVLCTCPDGDPAAHLAETLVAESLAACVNRVPGVVSHYRWQDRLQQDTETLLLIKTSQERLAALSARIRDLHPYELPEVLAVPVQGGLEEYLEWIRTSVSAESSRTAKPR